MRNSVSKLVRRQLKSYSRHIVFMGEVQDGQGIYRGPHENLLAPEQKDWAAQMDFITSPAGQPDNLMGNYLKDFLGHRLPVFLAIFRGGGL
jgi:hypothetical protein